MSDRSKQRGHRGLRVAGGLAAGAACAMLVVAGATPASAAPKPSPSPSVTTPPGLALHVDLPGLLQVHVDLPPLGTLLGGGRATTAPSPAVASPRPDRGGGSPVSRPTPTTMPTSSPTTSARRVPASRTMTPSAAPRSSTPVGTGGGAGIDTARSGRTVRDAAPTKARVVPDEVRKRAADAFHRSVVPVAPLWLLLVVLGACALGTAAVVRLAGRRDRVGA